MEKKIEKVSQFYAALAQGDFETVGALLSDDLVWHQPRKGTLSGVYSGKQNVFAHLGKMAQLSNGTFAIDQENYVTEKRRFGRDYDWICGVGKRTFNGDERNRPFPI